MFYYDIYSMAAQLIKLFEENPDPRKMEMVVDCLRTGGVIIYPTDTVYGIGCDIFNQRAIERICQIKGVKPSQNNFSFICYDLSHISDYARQLSTSTFKLMKKALPGSYTFIVNCSHQVPKILQTKRKTVGIRVPDHNVPRDIVRMLGNPIITTSVHYNEDFVEEYTNPELMAERYANEVDIVIDGGIGGMQSSTVIDCTDDEFEVLREGKGDLYLQI